MTKEIPINIGDAFAYCASTGVLTRRIRCGNYAAGTDCTSLSTNKKYLKTRFENKDYLLHRIAWFLHYGDQPPEVVDHEDGNGLNNSALNLRNATTSTNQMNIGATSKSTTGIKGIFPIRGGKLYRAEVCIDGKRHQKCSADPAKLEQWVIDKRAELHGQYACN